MCFISKKCYHWVFATVSCTSVITTVVSECLNLSDVSIIHIPFHECCSAQLFCIFKRFLLTCKHTVPADGGFRLLLMILHREKSLDLSWVPLFWFGALFLEIKMIWLLMRSSQCVLSSCVTLKHTTNTSDVILILLVYKEEIFYLRQNNERCSCSGCYSDEQCREK